MKKGCSFIFGWCLLISVTVLSIHFVALNPNFYISRYEKMELASQIEVSQDDLNKSIIVLLDYIEDKTDSLQDTITWKQKKQDMFNEREIKHMVDVKKLYQNAKIVGIGCGILAIGIGVYFWLCHRKVMIAYLTKGLLQAFGCMLIMLVFFGGWALYDFTSFWTWFHTIFFTNDLWLLNPMTDFMICMLPETIFSQLIGNIVLAFCGMLVPVLLFSIYYQIKKAPIGFEGMK